MSIHIKALLALTRIQRCSKGINVLFTGLILAITDPTVVCATSDTNRGSCPTVELHSGCNREAKCILSSSERHSNSIQRNIVCDFCLNNLNRHRHGVVRSRRGKGISLANASGRIVAARPVVDLDFRSPAILISDIDCLILERIDNRRLSSPVRNLHGALSDRRSFDRIILNGDLERIGLFRGILRSSRDCRRASRLRLDRASRAVDFHNRRIGAGPSYIPVSRALRQNRRAQGVAHAEIHRGLRLISDCDLLSKNHNADVPLRSNRRCGLAFFSRRRVRSRDRRAAAGHRSNQTARHRSNARVGAIPCNFRTFGLSNGLQLRCCTHARQFMRRSADGEIRAKRGERAQRQHHGQRQKQCQCFSSKQFHA